MASPSQSVSQTYTYDPTTKRLRTITINGVTLTYNYLPNSNQISSITAGDVTTTFTPDSTDKSRLGEMSVTDASDNTLYDGTYTYNENDQRTGDDVTQTVVADDGTTSSQSDTLGYTYDPSEDNALTQVTDNGTVTGSYSYDGTGNFTSNATIGTANSVNEYAILTYNGRGDLTGDANQSYAYDAEDRLIGVTPRGANEATDSEQYGYDGQGRMSWEQVTDFGNSTTYHFVWSGSELFEKLDGNNNVLQQYTWGPGENGQDQVLAITDFSGGSPHTYALIYDASGNVSMMVDPTSGSVVASYSYTPYGALVSATGPQAALNPFRGKGYWTDAAAPGIG